MNKKRSVRRVYTEAEWLEAKNKTIGGSEAAAIINKSKWLTPDDLYNKLVYGKAKSVAPNEKMARGTAAEEHIRALFALDFAKQFRLIKLPTKKKVMYVRADKPYISCSPDALAINLKTGKRWGVEFKYVELIKNEDKNVWEGGMLPDQYFCQCLQYDVAMPELEGVILFAHCQYFRHDDETDEWLFDHAVDRPYVIARKDVADQIEFLERKETEFWTVNIQGRKRPKLRISLSQ